MAKLAKNRLNSTWTPLNNEELNGKIFIERRSLVGKWFDKWNDSQRMLVLEDLLARCRVKQLEQVTLSIAKRKPMMHDDFTRNFPRVLSIYVFSFLDPRSLCRCAQVSWHWKNLTDLDQIWMRKCLRLGWLLTFAPSPFESGLWKRLYIENIVAIKNNLPAIEKKLSVKELENLAMLSKTRDGRSSAVSSARLRSGSQLLDKKPPWKGSDPTPKDTWRNNYLENDDEIEKVNKLRKRGLYGVEAEDIHRRARQRVNTGRHSMKRSGSLTRTKSVVIGAEAVHSQEAGYRPLWATPSKVSLNYSSGEEENDPRAAFRPSSANLSRKKNGLSSQRSARDPPSADLFPSKPWHPPAATEDDLDTHVY